MQGVAGRLLRPPRCGRWPAPRDLAAGAEENSVERVNPKDLRGLKVLVIDDEPDIRELLNLTLTRIADALRERR